MTSGVGSEQSPPGRPTLLARRILRLPPSHSATEALRDAQRQDQGEGEAVGPVAVAERLVRMAKKGTSRREEEAALARAVEVVEALDEVDGKQCPMQTAVALLGAVSKKAPRHKASGRLAEGLFSRFERWLGPLPPEAHERVVASHGASGGASGAEAALTALERLRTARPDRTHRALALAIDACAKVANEIVCSGAHCREGWVAAVEALHDEDGASRPSEAAYAAAIGACGAAGHAEEALGLYAELEQRLAASGRAPTAESVRRLVDAVCAANRPAHAELALARLRKSSGKADLTATARVMRAYGAAGDVSAVERLLEELERDRVAGAAAYAAAARARLDAGHPDAARTWLMRVQRHNPATLALLVEAVAATDGGEAAVDKLRAIGGGTELDAAVFSAGVHACARASPADAAGAVALVRAMRTAYGLRGNGAVASGLIKALGEAGDVRGARAALGEALETDCLGNRDAVQAHTSLVCALTKTGDGADAMEAFEAMRAAGLRPDGAAWRAAARAAAVAAPPGGALRAAKRMLTEASMDKDGEGDDSDTHALTADKGSLALLAIAARADGLSETAAEYARSVAKARGDGRAMEAVARGAALSAAAERGDGEGVLKMLLDGGLGGGADADAGDWANAMLAADVAGDEEAALKAEMAAASEGAGRGERVQPRASFWEAEGGKRQRRRREVGNGPSDLGDDAEWMLSQLREYAPDERALPLAIRGEKGDDDRRRRGMRALRCHCEKKALGALLRAGERRPVIAVNVRMCGDCHRAFELASAHFDHVEAIVCNDRGTVHRFEGGQCSCGGGGARPKALL